MPVECEQLENAPVRFGECRACGTSPFIPFMRGEVQSWIRKNLGLRYCALICRNCKELVGWEKPKDPDHAG